MRSDEQLEVEIDSLTVDGCGNTADGQYAIFGALAGEKVRAVHLAKKKKKKFLRTVEVLEASNLRVQPACPAAAYCGGCSFQHLQHDEQLRLKQDFLASLLRPLEPRSWLAPLTGAPYGYRSKARLGVKYVEKKGRVLVGFREKQKPYIADIENCPVLSSGLDDLIEPLENLVSQLSAVRAIPQIEVASGEDATALVIRHLEPLNDNDLGLLKSFAEQRGLSIYLQSGGPATVEPLVLADGQTYLHYELPDYGLKFSFAPLDFTQVNLAMNRLMVKRALDLLQPGEDDRILDAFCGIGNFSLAIAASGAEVIAAEQSTECIDRARLNAANNDINNVVFEVADLHGEPPEVPGFTGVNKVLLDPPRCGALALVKMLASSDVERVVYVSCNPETLARDVKYLVEQGFILRSAGIIDMFPHTTHVESVVLLSRQSRGEDTSS